jgi:hypothetical protein
MALIQGSGSGIEGRSLSEAVARHAVSVKFPQDFAMVTQFRIANIPGCQRENYDCIQP